MGCFLFRLPPSYRYTNARLKEIVSQLDPARRNVIEFRHASWWNEEVYSAFRKNRDNILPLQRTKIAEYAHQDSERSVYPPAWSEARVSA
jgi:uncharacterized protein YecE (DUF72 family)